MLFKEGDRVVILYARENASASECRRVGKVRTISSITAYPDGEFYVILLGGGIYHSSDLPLEHEAVFNSPLYKALS
jgi:hypothetical protein